MGEKRKMNHLTVTCSRVCSNAWWSQCSTNNNGARISCIPCQQY